MAVFAVLIEYDVPDEGNGELEQALTAMLDVVRNTTPVRPTNVTAFAGELALDVLRAGGIWRPQDQDPGSGRL